MFDISSDQTQMQHLSSNIEDIINNYVKQETNAIANRESIFASSDFSPLKVSQKQQEIGHVES